MHTSTMLKVLAGFLAAVLAVASLAPVAQAQGSGFAAEMKVPFAFETASGQRFEPGVYTIRIAGQQTLLIRGKATVGLAMTQLANDGLPATQGKAVFTHYGNQYFLHAVSVAGEREPPSLQDLEGGTAVANRGRQNTDRSRGGPAAERELKPMLTEPIATAHAMSSSDSTVGGAVIWSRPRYSSQGCRTGTLYRRCAHAHAYHRSRPPPRRLLVASREIRDEATSHKVSACRPFPRPSRCRRAFPRHDRQSCCYRIRPHRSSCG
jgi:hypothetical protein